LPLILPDKSRARLDFDPGDTRAAERCDTWPVAPLSSVTDPTGDARRGTGVSSTDHAFSGGGVDLGLAAHG
jgi:hypothetical protein